MKTRLLKFAGTLLIIMASTVVFAQDPPPPPNGGHGQSGNQQPGGSAPIDSGIAYLISLSAVYGLKKFFHKKWKNIPG